MEQAGPELSIIVPTFEERANIEPLVGRVREAMGGASWELIVVDDDSADGTAEHVKSLSHDDPRVRCIHRIGRRGLASACIEGVLAAASPIVAIMDADLQHPPEKLPELLEAVRDGADIAVASREGNADFGNMPTWRQRLSRFASRLSRLLLKTSLNDPMSGFFAMRRDTFMKSVRGLSGVGFKILLDVASSAPSDMRVIEVPYVFQDRTAGQSKLDLNAAWSLFIVLIDKTVGHWLPIRFVIFSIVGALGAIVHFAVLGSLHRGFGVAFVTSQSVATFAAILFNFCLNNILTFRDRRRRGAEAVLGFLVFLAASSVGAIANVGVAAFMFTVQGLNWSVSAVFGIALGAVWNFAISQTFVWPGAQKPPKRARRRAT